MIRDVKTWRQWEAQWQRSYKSSPEENLSIFWTLLKMAEAAGAWPPDNPLEGIETDIELARKINTYVEPPGKAGKRP